jgi:hypothetical protein
MNFQSLKNWRNKCYSSVTSVFEFSHEIYGKNAQRLDKVFVLMVMDCCGKLVNLLWEL